MPNSQATEPRMGAFFLPTADGQRFCVLHQPPEHQVPCGAVVYIHPFAEEMNRARRMASLQARALANAGFAVLQMDLYGCGDSSGDFAAATWNGWLDDVELAASWLTARAAGPLWFWGLRASCLLAAQAAARLSYGGVANLLMWQPALSGGQYLKQFLRLKFASNLARGRSGESTDMLVNRLAAGEAVEVAGYLLSPPLAQGLQLASLQSIQPAGRLVCFELQPSAEQPLSPPLATLLQCWADAGQAASGQVVVGGHFWQSVEMTTCPALLEASIAAVTESPT